MTEHSLVLIFVCCCRISIRDTRKQFPLCRMACWYARRVFPLFCHVAYWYARRVFPLFAAWHHGTPGGCFLFSTKKNRPYGLLFLCVIIYLCLFYDYSSEAASSASSAGAALSRAFMLRLIFLSASLKSTTLAVISCPTFSTSAGLST